jgi:NAD(P)-dependent dehydrogenase (short-subunit alcohol dehydrogenase family)
MVNEAGLERQFDVATAPPSGLSRAGQVALVTGGSAGLGLAIASTLADAGSDFVLASRSAEHCERAAARLSAQTGRIVQGRIPATTSPPTWEPVRES